MLKLNLYCNAIKHCVERLCVCNRRQKPNVSALTICFFVFVLFLVCLINIIYQLSGIYNPEQNSQMLVAICNDSVVIKRIIPRERRRVEKIVIYLTRIKMLTIFYIAHTK